jgi:long-subunit acyl-CoA synthetase (AMP-forming)
MQAWVAILALLFSSLAPAAHHLLNPTAGKSQVAEICTNAGVKAISLNADTPAKLLADLKQDMPSHCAYCITHGSTSAIPSPSAMTFAVAGEQTLIPLLFFSASATLFPWTVAPSRAPPAFA